MQIYLSILAALCYICGTILPVARARAISAVVAGGWALHGLSLWAGVTGPETLRVGFAMMLSSTLWICVAAYWLENRNYSLDGMRVMVLPVALLSVLLPTVFPGEVVSLSGVAPVFVWHIVISILAYSTLTIAAFHAVLMLLQESRLHGRSVWLRDGWFALALDRLPALLAMEKLLFRLITVGFILLTLTVLSGIAFSEQLFHVPFMMTHKTIFTLLSWLLFGVLLAGRHWQGWRGKRALAVTLAGFTVLLLAYVGSRFVLEVILHRVIV